MTTQRARPVSDPDNVLLAGLFSIPLVLRLIAVGTEAAEFFSRTDVTREFVAELALTRLTTLLIPFMIAGAGVLAPVARRRPWLTVAFGVAGMFVFYTTLVLISESQIVACHAATGYMCGEWVFITYLDWLLMFIVNVLALAGLSLWVRRRDA